MQGCQGERRGNLGKDGKGNDCGVIDALAASGLVNVLPGKADSSGGFGVAAGDVSAAVNQGIERHHVGLLSGVGRRLQSVDNDGQGPGMTAYVRSVRVGNGGRFLVSVGAMRACLRVARMSRRERADGRLPGKVSGYLSPWGNAQVAENLTATGRTVADMGPGFEVEKRFFRAGEVGALDAPEFMAAGGCRWFSDGCGGGHSMPVLTAFRGRV
ncbi:MAG: hypothetical protein J5X22_09435 [Candidatus Accumulibacter sp.]|uniref:hypothetical protein n=1 Tax=Accumulibacter sp. TaxID=2053492 RepID=UPI001AD2530C|nr:hypothetical protein [Accumulibacter sp.]MBN8516793.1 hypothetical protein [Accumulibacter sp.]MBO3710724.1 hypothetical protein [Accumulibacter sp.]